MWCLPACLTFAYFHVYFFFSRFSLLFLFFFSPLYALLLPPTSPHLPSLPFSSLLFSSRPNDPSSFTLSLPSSTFSSGQPSFSCYIFFNTHSPLPRRIQPGYPFLTLTANTIHTPHPTPHHLLLSTLSLSLSLSLHPRTSPIVPAVVACCFSYETHLKNPNVKDPPPPPPPPLHTALFHPFVLNSIRQTDIDSVFQYESHKKRNGALNCPTPPLSTVEK